MTESIVPQIILQVILILLNAVFASAEIAVISMNDARLAALAAKGDKRAVKLARLTSKPAKFLATIQVAITLSGFLGSAFAADNFSQIITDAIMSTGIKIPEKTVDTFSLIVITLILSYFTLIFGELVPKRIAMRKAEQLALAVSGLVSFISCVFAPIVWLLTASTNGVLRLIGIDPNQKDDEVTEEEIRMMVDAGSENGTIQEQEKEIIQNVFEFDDMTADEIATHRTGITLLWLEETDEQWQKTIYSSRHTYFPVCDNDIDNIVGVLNSKNYFRLNDKSRENVMKNAVKTPYFVPETIKADVLFREMKLKKEFFAIVIDEYGGMSGIVTITDLLECIVGEIGEEAEAEVQKVPEIEALDSKNWRICGCAPIEDVQDALGVSIEEDDDDFVTFAGYVLKYLDAIPKDGETAVVDTPVLTIKVTKVLDHRIERTLVTVKEQPENTASESEDN